VLGEIDPKLCSEVDGFRERAQPIHLEQAERFDAHTGDDIRDGVPEDGRGQRAPEPIAGAHERDA
jgi:hypothetical protein